MENYLVLLTHTIAHPILEADGKINDWPWVAYILLAMAYLTVALTVCMVIMFIYLLLRDY
jgi:uncharacterized protein YpmS